MRDKADATFSEIVLVVGILLVASIIIFQLRTVFLAETEISKEGVIGTFTTDLSSYIDKAISITGDAKFSYRPLIKNYKLTVDNNTVSILDKNSGKISMFAKSNPPKLVDTTIEDKQIIFIIKKEGQISFKGG